MIIYQRRSGKQFLIMFYAWVYATGSTDARTRLYRMGINKYFEEVEAEFYIFGEQDDDWLPYEKEIDFEGYVVKRKN